MKDYTKKVLDKNRNKKNIIILIIIFMTFPTILYLIDTEVYSLKEYIIIESSLSIIFISLIFIVNLIHYRTSNNMMNVFCYAIHERGGWESLEEYFKRLKLHILILQEPVSMFILGNLYIRKGIKQGKKLIDEAIKLEPELCKLKSIKQFDRKDSDFLFELRQKSKRIKPTKIIKALKEYDNKEAN